MEPYTHLAYSLLTISSTKSNEVRSVIRQQSGFLCPAQLPWEVREEEIQSYQAHESSSKVDRSASAALLWSILRRLTSCLQVDGGPRAGQLTPCWWRLRPCTSVRCRPVSWLHLWLHGCLMVFKRIGGSWSIIVATCVVGTRGWPAGQDHPANIPRPVQMCPVGMPHELRIVRVFSCVARGFKARPSFMFAGC